MAIYTIWVPDVGKLQEHAKVEFIGDDLQQTVGHYLTNGGWNVEQLLVVLPEYIVLKIYGIQAGIAQSGQDKLIWKWNKCGNFSVKSAYNGLIAAGNSLEWKWKFIWGLKIPPRVQHFLWIMLHGKILTNHQRARRGLSSDTSCPRCDGGIEDIDHLVRRCPSSRHVWVDVSRDIYNSDLFDGNFDLWLQYNLKNNTNSAGNTPSFLIFALTLWFLWKWRCSTVFDINFVAPQLPYLIIAHYAKDWWTANYSDTNRGTCSVSVAWNPPEEDWVKLNIDGSCCSVTGTITAGGSLRNSQKEWIHGFVLNKGLGTALEAELWGMFEGLRLVWQLGFKKIVVETDTLHVVQLLCTENFTNHPYFSLIKSCTELVNGDWRCVVRHIYREGNALADGLAKMGHKMDLGVWFFDNPPAEIRSILVDDCRGIPYFRQCSTTPMVIP